jgi:hypothetical protein
MKADFTRSTFRPKKHYRQVNHQQGRVGLDADWNEQAEITAYRSEIEARDVIGPAGAPKHEPAFTISIPNGTPSGDFFLGPGRFYVEGILCENDTEILFTGQPDLPGTTHLTTPGRYAVYLDVWQRHLTALDDPEIREVALGGPDTATRTKTIWQVRTGSIEANMTCASKPAPWKIESDGRLSARAQPDAKSDKPCIVPPGAGYRRLENQLYRVEIHRAGPWWDESLAGPNVRLVAPATFKWSRDNGFITALIGSIGPNTITLTAARKDPVLGFAPGHWIEIIDAGNELRGEPGTLVRITAVDDLVLTVDLTTVVGTFPSTLDLALLPKVRHWDSVGEVIVTAPSSNDGFIPLEDGMEVKFERGSYDTGDYWMIPARTDLGRVEWPQVPGSSPSVPEAQRPLGIQHHFCCLAIIEVTTAPTFINGVPTGLSGPKITLIEDCRRLFPPLTELEDACGCCTKTVGHTGESDYRSIQDAVDSLPVTGGQICVLAGTYAERVVIASKRNITIIGCHERSVLRPDPLESGPIIQIEGGCRDIRLEALVFKQEIHSAVAVLDGERVTICECEIVVTNPQGSEPSIFFHCTQGLIERNVIRPQRADESFDSPPAAPAPADAAAPFVKAAAPAANGTQSTVVGTAPPPPAHPASGIQLAGGSFWVRVIDNFIFQVKGQGITLGDLREAPVKPAPASGTAPKVDLPRKMIFGRLKNPDDRCADCKEISNEVPPHPSSKAALPTLQLISAESLGDIRIERNEIQGAGLDGIGVIGFFDLSQTDEFVTVRRLTILGNTISGCLTVTRAPITAAWVDRMGYGGIALADVSELIIHDNVIEGNGAGPQPVCGIFILHGEGIDIQRNRIFGNGQADSSLTPQLGPRGGIYVVYALAPIGTAESVGTFEPATGDQLGFNQAPLRLGEATGFPALKVHNNIVSAQVGRALTATALGPVSVVGNQLTTGHVNKTSELFVFDPATVFIFNLGLSNEIYGQFFVAVLGGISLGTDAGLDDLRLGKRLANGNMLFADNQCSLDLLEQGGSGILFTSIVLMSLDDIGFHNNQCDCNLGFGEDFVAVHALLLGASLRATGNRFKEGWFSAMFSAFTIGILNTTAHNQATHCLMVTGGPGQLTHNGPNTVLNSTFCRPGFRDTAVAFNADRAQS